MRFIPTKIHGILDYALGAFLIALPFILGYETGAPMLVPVILGATMIVMSLLTDYEMGALRKIRMATHLFVDFLSGAFLAISPWLFNFDEVVWIPYLVLGVAEIIAALTTEKTPHHLGHHHHHHHHTHGHA